MKKTLLILILPLSTFAQQTITSVMNGNASNPFVWDCTCFPGTNDHVIVNHAISMDVNWAVTSGGSITVNNSGSLLQSGFRNLLVDGASSTYTNHGNSHFNNIAYTNGAIGLNDGQFSISTAIYFGPGTTYTNSGQMDGIDSIMTEGIFNNSGILYTGNNLNTGTFNNTGAISADSMGNTGTFNSTNGFMTFTAFGNSGTFNMTGSGFMDVTNNWFNIGDFTLGSGLQIYAHEDFYNGDSLGGLANLHNNGMIEVHNDFFNGFNVDGSGSFCVANDSYNIGAMSGNFNFCDMTGTDIDWNSGTVAGSITFCTPGCAVSVEELTNHNVEIYPNPSNGNFKINGLTTGQFVIYDLSGKKMKEGIINTQEIDLSTLNNGSYIIEMINDSQKVQSSIVIRK